ncbi:MAG: hypothetical protein AAF806_30095 [Bacteroidota bacterium]
MKTFILSFFLVFSSLFLNAQRTQTVYVEALGNGVVYSVNYDTRFADMDHQFGLRLGTSILRGVGYLIVQPNYLFGEGKHKFELGAGLTALLSFTGEEGVNQVAANGALMYRFQKPDGNFLFRVGLAPTFVPIDENDTFSGLSRVFWVWPGVSFGYKF